jgi:hypothetical protein
MQPGLWAGICAAGFLSGPVLAQQSAAPEFPQIAASPPPSSQTLPPLPSSAETGEAAQSEPQQQAAGTGQAVTNPQPTPSPQTPPSLLMMALQSTCAGDLLSSQRIRINGWVDEGYTYSTSGPGRLSVEPLPNRFGDEFTFNQVTFVVERPLDPKELSWGFVIRTYAGADAALFDPIRGAIIPNPDPRFGFDVGTALFEAHLPVLTEGGVDVEVGQHLPIIGYEAALPTLRNIYSNDYQFFYGLPGLATGVFVTTHVNQQLDIEGAVTLGTPVFFASLSVAPVYMGVVSYWLEEDKKTQISPAVVIGPFSPQSNVITTTESVTVTRNWNRYLTQAVQFYGCYSNAGVLVPGLERAYGLYNIFICHVDPKVDLNFRAEWYDDVDGRSYPGGTAFKTNYEEITLAVDYHPTTWLQLRPELRGDFANDARALGPVGGPLNHSQLTAAIECLIRF